MTIVEKYYEENKSKDNQILLSLDVCNDAIFKMSPSEILEFILTDMCKMDKKTFVSASHMSRQRLVLSRYLAWCVEKGYTTFNPIEEADILEYRNILFEVARRSDVKVYYYDELPYFDDTDDWMCVNPFIYILFWYAKGLEDLLSIKVSDIDEAYSVIRIGGKRRHITKGVLTEVYRYIDQKECFAIKGSNTVKRNMLRYKDYLVKVFSDKDTITEEQYKRNARRTLEAGMPGIKARDLVMSGILHEVRRELKGLDDEEFCELILGDARNSKLRDKGYSLVEVYNKVFNRHGYKPSTSIKDEITIYLAKSKYYQ